ENFALAGGGEARDDLEGYVGAAGPWRRSVGERPFGLGPGGVTVPPPAPTPPRSDGWLGRARRLTALARPGGERLAYTVAWADPHLADLSAETLPPGSARHQGEGSRAGLVFW